MFTKFFDFPKNIHVKTSLMKFLIKNSLQRGKRNRKLFIKLLTVKDMAANVKKAHVVSQIKECNKQNLQCSSWLVTIYFMNDKLNMYKCVLIRT